MAEDTGKDTGAVEKPEPVVEEPETKRTFTEDEVNVIVESRLARDRKKVADYDEVKAKAERLDEIELENQTEVERSKTEAAEEKAKREELERSNREIVARSSLLQEVAKPEHNIVDPEGAVEFLLGADSSLVELDDSGRPTNVEDAVAKLVEKRSYLVTTEVKPAADADLGARGGSKANQLTEADLKGMTPQEIVTARNEGRLDDVLSGKK